MIKPKWLEQHISWTNFYDPKDVQAIEVRLYREKEVDFVSKDFLRWKLW